MWCLTAPHITSTEDMKIVKEKYGSTLYSTQHATVHAVVENNCDRTSIYFMTTSRGKRFLFIRNPYNQEVRLKYDSGEELVITESEKIIPVEYTFYHTERNLLDFWNKNV